MNGSVSLQQLIAPMASIEAALQAAFTAPLRAVGISIPQLPLGPAQAAAQTLSGAGVIGTIPIPPVPIPTFGRAAAGDTSPPAIRTKGV